MVDLRPLSLGEIIDRAASIWRANWKGLFKLFLGFQLGLFVLLKAWELLVRTYFPAARGGTATIEALQTQPEVAFKQVGWTVATGGVLMLMYLVIGYFSGIACSHYVWPRMLGRTATIAQSLRRAVDRSATLVGFFGLMLGWTGVVAGLLMLPAAIAVGGAVVVGEGPAAAILAIIGGLLALAGLLVAFLWFVLRFLLASQVLALEDVPALGVFKRCDDLASGRIEPGFLGLVKVRLTILFTVVTAIISTVSLVAGLPALIIQGSYGNLLDPARATPDAVPQLLLVPAQLLQVVAQSIVGPMFVVFAVVFYADMRVRREGLDLQLKLEETQQ